MPTRRTIMYTSLAVLSLIAARTAQAVPFHTIHGHVTYRERMVLPPGARLDVRLEDTSLADAPAVTLAQAGYTISGAPPLPYTLTYGALPSRARLALRAEIRLNDRLLFTTDTFHGLDEPDIVLHRIMNAPASDETTPAGTWHMVEMSGQSDTQATVPGARGPVLTIEPGGKIHGNGGCNGMFVQATINGSSIHFGPTGATRMACDPATMALEQRFFTALEQVTSWSLDSGTLVLSSQDGTRLMRLAPVR